jgi:hypothetical protein
MITFAARLEELDTPLLVEVLRFEVFHRRRESEAILLATVLAGSPHNDREEVCKIVHPQPVGFLRENGNALPRFAQGGQPTDEYFSTVVVHGF